VAWRGASPTAFCKHLTIKELHIFF